MIITAVNNYEKDNKEDKITADKLKNIIKVSQSVKISVPSMDIEINSISEKNDSYKITVHIHGKKFITKDNFIEDRTVNFVMDLLNLEYIQGGNNNNGSARCVVSC